MRTGFFSFSFSSVPLSKSRHLTVGPKALTPLPQDTSEHHVPGTALKHFADGRPCGMESRVGCGARLGVKGSPSLP